MSFQSRNVGGLHVLIPGTPENADAQVAFLEKRARFVQEECARRGWPEDVTKLTLAQILEIRELPGWKSPA